MRTRLLATLILVALVAPAGFAKRKDDVVVMKNGDRITGEIKKLDQGGLIFKADYMADSVKLDWAEIDRLESKDPYNVTLTSGHIHSGLIEEKKPILPGGSSFSIAQDAASVQVQHQDVVAIAPVEDSFWKQLTGSVDYGFSFTSGENVTQSSLAADVTYRAEKWSVETNLSSVFNAQSDSANSGRNTLDILYAKYLTQRWFAGALGQLLNSKQQELTLRTTGGGGLGRKLIRTPRTTLVLLTGVNFSRERYSPESGNSPQVNNAEALFQMRYSMFRFSSTQVNLDLYSYPSLSTFGRVRTGLQTSLKFEIFRNFFWKFSLYENFDNQPPIHTPRNDFGTSTSVGWKF